MTARGPGEVGDNAGSQEHRASWAVDPRPDLGDGELWGRLLENAARLDGTGPDSALGWLRGVRCLGATLYARPDRRPGLRLPTGAGDPAGLVAELGDRRAIVRQALELAGEPEGWTCEACGKVSIGATCWNCATPRAA